MTQEPEYIDPLQVAEPTSTPPAKDAIYLKMTKSFMTKWQDAKVQDGEELDPTKPYCPPDWAISIRGIDVFAFDEFNYMSGQSGNGKSFTNLIYESVILGKPFGEVKYVGNRPKPKVLHIDTEQSEGNVQLHVRRLYHMVRWDQGTDHRDQFRVVMLRNTPTAAERWGKVLNVCEEFRPDFVFVDGLLDMVKSMNDEEECSRVISEAIALADTIKACFVGVCHENPTGPKSEGPIKPAGHVGSFAQRKGSAGQTARKKKEGIIYFEVNPQKVRNKDYDGFRFGVKDETVTIDKTDYKMGIPYWMDTIPTNADSPTPEPSKPAKKEPAYPADPMAFFKEKIPYGGLGTRAMREMLGKELGIGHGKADDYCDEMERRHVLVKLNGKYFINANTMDEDNSPPF